MFGAVVLSFLLATPAAAAEWTPSDSDVAVHRALSVRHKTLSCTEVEALSTEPLQTLRNMVAHASAPPWAPMRAASCIVELHPVEAQPDLERWVSDSKLEGLRIQTLKQLPTMPEAVARAVALKAIAAFPTEVSMDDLAARDPRLLLTSTSEQQP